MPESDRTFEGLLTQYQAAERAGVHDRTIRKWVDAGKLTPAHQFPGPKGLKLFWIEDVDRAKAEASS